MNADPFYFEIKDLITQFVSAFDGVVIKRFNKQREIKDRIQVRYVYAPKQRVVHDLQNKSKSLTLPVVAVNMTNISRDNTRVFNKLDSSYYRTTDSFNSTDTGVDISSEDVIPQPVPVNINISMSILTKFQSDMDQIISNFVPYTNPYIVISWKLPVQFANIVQEIRSEVLWSDQINLTYPVEIQSNSPYRVAADTSFTIKGWLFRKNVTPVKTIFTIDTTMYSPSSLDVVRNLNDSDELLAFNELFEGDQI